MGNIKDYATSTVATAPSPATSGASLDVAPGHGSRFPAAPFNITAHPANEIPTLDNAERLLVTGVSGDTLTVVRAQGDTAAKNIAVGWRITNSLFKEDLEIIVNVQDYGAVGDGVADDSDGLQDAIDFVSGAGGGVVYIPVGTYLTAPLEIPSLVTLQGEQKDATIIKLKDAQDAHLIYTTDFDTLTGTDTTNGAYGFGIKDLTLDGNKANNVGGNVLSFYGYGYLLQNVNLRNGSAWGLWTEYGTQSLPSTDIAVEGKIINFVIHDNHVGGIYFKGPHDSHIYDGVVYYNGHSQLDSINIHVDGEQFSNGTVFQNVHSWGGTFDIGVYIAANGISFKDCQLEGATKRHVVVDADQTHLENCKIFSIGTQQDTVKGVVLINNANNLYARYKAEDCGGGAIDFSGAGIGHNVEIFSVYYSGFNDDTGIVGAIPDGSYVRLHMLNGAGEVVESINRLPMNTDTEQLTATQATIIPNTGDAQTLVESAADGDRAEVSLRGHDATNDGDTFTMSLRTDQADVVQSVFDASTSTYHQLYEYDYLLDRVKHAKNQDVWQGGDYANPTDENQLVLAHRDSSDGATKPKWGIAFVNNADDFTGTIGKAARIFAERMADWGNRVDLVFSSYFGGAITEVMRIANGVVSVVGNLTTTGTVNGRNMTTDGDKLDGIAAGAQVNTVTSVASKTGAVTLAKADVGLGSVDNTSNATERAAAATLTNKRINPRVSSTTSASSLTPTIASFDQYVYTALAANLTINAPTGTPVVGNKLLFAIKDNGTSRTLTWNAAFAPIGVTLPAATTVGKWHYIGFIYNASAAKWHCIAATVEG